MVKAREYVVLSFVFTMLFTLVVSAQNKKINRVDANGKRTGVWRKYYKNGDIRYKGEFKNGKEVGKFYFFEEGGAYPSIIKTFSATSDTAVVKFYNKTRVKTQGKMVGKKRVGKWTYFFSDGKTIFSEENYTDGKLDGLLKNYYMNGNVTEASEYQNGKQHGSSKIYTEEGKMIEDVIYVNGVLEGEAKYYDLNGVIKEKGIYKDGKRVGKWEFYIDGEISKKGRPDYSIKKKKKDQ
ncbi:toxin-antitoxin system YwqK family antitoxin [uncultured Tenacibaculum sp.]|uniref:toxin-antitoxin system YwqK family antitoxin n=1 Tax=uncultured Tenacibaculum sp. TaxID=174713 RepID=UPI002629711F|nr:toxin-antitoxin system YwqK family antitoxin [uncultured Tenacibaculum sp.]